MLGKLLKYDIPMLGRKLFPLYLGWIATAALLGVAIGPFEGRSEFFVVISGLLYAAAAGAVLVMAVIMIVQRYNNSLLGDGGYFSHVLPVTATEHVASKTISAVIWVLASGVAMIITGLIIALCSGHFLDIFKIDWAQIFANINGEFWLSVLEMFVASIFSIAKSILAIYAAITIGHQAMQHNVMASIGAYFGVLIFESVVARTMFGIFGKRFFSIESNRDLNLLLLIGIIVSILIGAIYFFICKYLMEKRLNLN